MTNDDDIFQMVRTGNLSNVRLWIDNIENDFNICDDHSFSLLHWACWDGKLNLVELLIQRGAKINSLNKCNDTPLHCAVKNGHLEVTRYLIRYKINVNATNLHGNTPLHYACYHSYIDIATELINSGALANLCNRNSLRPLDLCKNETFFENLQNKATAMQQNLEIKIPFNNQQPKWTRTKSIESSVSNTNQIDINELETKQKLESNPTHQTWLGVWQSIDVIIKILNKSSISSSAKNTTATSQSQARITNSFQLEYKKLRIFNCNNVLPVLGVCLNWPYFILLTQYSPNGTLFDVLHVNQASLVIKQKVQIAVDIAKGMSFLHQLDASPFVHLNSKHVVLDQDFKAKINMSNYVFETLNPLNRLKVYSPAWQSPESLIKMLNELNKEAVNMWSFAVCLWEIYTSKIPFEDVCPMQCGLSIVRDGARLQLPTDMSTHWVKLIRICMNEEPAKRPKFEMIISILEKLVRN
jgi:integrin-linked kinase